MPLLRFPLLQRQCWRARAGYSDTRGEDVKLSSKQQRDLKSLLDPNSPVANRGVTNSTLSSLEKRGLAEIAMSYKDHIRIFRWKITDAGRKLVLHNTKDSK